MRLVLDTNIVVSALLWKGSPRRLLRVATIARAALFTSDPLLAELADVLSRSKLKKNIAALGVSSNRLFETYARQAELVQPVGVPRIAPDPDDDVAIGTALAAKADFLVTGDHALLSVVKYENVRIVSVREALDAIARSIPHEY
jgi:putative PIN family toxin of toxin-antitoxin system